MAMGYAFIANCEKKSETVHVALVVPSFMAGQLADEILLNYMT